MQFLTGRQTVWWYFTRITIHAINIFKAICFNKSRRIGYNRVWPNINNETQQTFLLHKCSEISALTISRTSPLYFITNKIRKSESRIHCTSSSHIQERARCFFPKNRDNDRMYIDDVTHIL